MITEKHDNVVDATERFQIPGPDHFVRVADGAHVGVVVGVQGFNFGRTSARVSIWFRAQSGELVPAYYKVRSTSKNGEPIKNRAHNPDFVAGWRSRIVRDLGVLFPDRYTPGNLPTAVPRIDGPVAFVTRTVRVDMAKRDRPEAFVSSVVDAILGWANDPKVAPCISNYLASHPDTGTGLDTHTHTYTFGDGDE